LSLRPRSTEVLIYSRPWIPSRVGRTISDKQAFERGYEYGHKLQVSQNSPAALV
jgi:hypothetical protein